MEEIFKTDKNLSPAKRNNEMTAMDKNFDVDYLRSLLGEIEKRKVYSLVCLTPEKIAASSASQLMKMVKDMDDMTSRIARKILNIESKAKTSGGRIKTNLSDDEKRRIEKFIK